MARHVRDSLYWGMPVGTPIVAGMRPARAKMAKGSPGPTAKPAGPVKMQSGAAATKFTAGGPAPTAKNSAPAGQKLSPAGPARQRLSAAPSPHHADLAKRTAVDLRREARTRGLKPGKANKASLVDMLAAEHAKAGLHGKSSRASGRDISTSVDFKALPDTAKTGENAALKAIGIQQGFDGRPQVVTAAEFDSAVKAGRVRETWRGLRQRVAGPPPADYAEQFRTGELHVGYGINGDGTYVAINKIDGQHYGATLLRIGLRKDAKVISADALDVEMDKYFAANAGRKSEELRALDEKLLKDLARASTARSRANIRRKYRNEVFGLDPNRSIALQRDPGVFAALRGYDAIEIPKGRSPDHHHEMIILNRTATIVQEA